MKLNFLGNYWKMTAISIVKMEKEPEDTVSKYLYLSIDF